jgi:hypothetical protein
LGSSRRLSAGMVARHIRQEQLVNEERKIVIASDSGVCIRSLADISDAIGACLGADGVILTEGDLSAEFFDLRSGLAGEVLQKFVNYRLRVAFVVPDPDVYGERFRELVYEHRCHTMIRFVRTLDEAKAWLAT